MPAGMLMPNIVVYLTPHCPYCMRARRLLEEKGVEYSVINVASDSWLWEEMIERSHRYTVPQIFIDDLHVGGFDDMKALDLAGRLDELLGLV
jgi:glutaredoxin 3